MLLPASALMTFLFAQTPQVEDICLQHHSQ
jgi:hypothetical protein